MSAFEQPELAALHRGLVRDAGRQPEYSNTAALMAYSEGVEHAIESLWLQGYRDVRQAVAAYEVPGPAPAYHRAAQEWLAHNWTALHNAITKLSKDFRA